MRSLLFICLLVIPVFVQAHEGHSSHGGGNPYKEFGIAIEAQQAVDFSKKVIDKLVSNNKLVGSWNDAVHVKSEQKVFKVEPEWIVSFKNTKAPAKKNVIYIFLSLYGDFLGANFTGN